MKFAVSNIAWSPADRLAAYAILKENGFRGLEIAPGLFFAGDPDPFAPSEASVSERVAEAERFGLQLVSMQSLFFGADQAALFGDAAAVELLSSRLRRAIELAARLRICNLVFGAPKQRVIPPGMAPEVVMTRLREVLLPLADLAASQQVRIALEPNAAAYSTNFMTTFLETLQVVAALNHPAIKLNFDTGALYMTDSFAEVASYVAQAGGQLSHAHISSANLAPAPVSTTDALAVLDALAAINYDRTVSIEMKAVPGDDLATLTASIERLRAAAQQRGYL